MLCVEASLIATNTNRDKMTSLLRSLRRGCCKGGFGRGEKFRQNATTPLFLLDKNCRRSFSSSKSSSSVKAQRTTAIAASSAFIDDEEEEEEEPLSSSSDRNRRHNNNNVLGNVVV